MHRNLGATTFPPVLSADAARDRSSSRAWLDVVISPYPSSRGGRDLLADCDRSAASSAGTAVVLSDEACFTLLHMWRPTAVCVYVEAGRGGLAVFYCRLPRNVGVHKLHAVDGCPNREPLVEGHEKVGLFETRLQDIANRSRLIASRTDATSRNPGANEKCPVCYGALTFIEAGSAGQYQFGQVSSLRQMPRAD